MLNVLGHWYKIEAITERENGYTAVSMKDDRTTIYGDGMIKMIDWGITL